MSSVRFLGGNKICTVTYNTVTQPKIPIVTGKTYEAYFNYKRALLAEEIQGIFNKSFSKGERA